MEKNALVEWMGKNASLFRHAGESFMLLDKKDPKILLYGRFASSLASFYDKLSPDGKIDIINDDEDGSAIPLLLGIGRFIEKMEGPYDYISFPLGISFMDTRMATGFFLSARTSLKKGGVLYFSFVESQVPELDGKTTTGHFLPEGRSVFMKRYTLTDIATTLSALSFKVAGIERDESSLGSIVTIIAKLS